MSEETSIQKSPLEQILEATFTFLEQQGQLNSETTQKLRQLASENSLTKPRVIRAIREDLEKKNETA
jgi:hypothetical protein